MSREAYELQGRQGVAFVGGGTATTLFTGRCAGFLALAETVIDAVTGDKNENSAALAGQTIAAGIYVPGEFASVEITSGFIACPLLEDSTVA